MTQSSDLQTSSNYRRFREIDLLRLTRVGADEWRINPLYAVTERDGRLDLRLTFPDAAYEDEYGACKRYLPEVATLAASDLETLQAGRSVAAITDLVRRRVLVALPKRYY